MQLEYAPLLNAISCSQFMIDYRSSKTFVFCKLHVASCSYVDNLVENLLETTQEKIWKGIY